MITIFFTAFIAVTYGFGMYLFALIVPDMRGDLGFNYTVVGIFTACAQVAFLLFALSSGVICPVIGAARVIIGSVVISGVCLVLSSFVTHAWQLGVLLTILGGCAASVWVPMVEVVGRLIPFQHRSKVIGLMSSGTSYGVFINGLIVPFFIARYSWHEIWLTVGTATVILTIISFIVLSRANVFARSGSKEAVNSKSRLFEGWNRSMFTRTNSVLWLMFLFIGLSLAPFQTYLAPYLRDEMGFSVELAGRVWSIIGFVGMGGGFAIGALSDRSGIRFALTLTYTFLGLAALLICFHAAQVFLLLAAVAFGLGFYAVYGLVPAYISKTRSPGESTIVFGIGNVAVGLGSMLGNFIGGWSESILGTFFWVYIANILIACFSMILCWTLPNERKVVNEPEIILSTSGKRENG